ncbi:cilia- and flagella-associated protein 300 [Anabrus simplex]|uniref:cilia- and flagella-associated protein 300 n=1 Tax=Anabrus simplex TaxID=316456 RepID=UPI0034DCDF6A
MENKYTFLYLEQKKYECFDDKDIKEFLMKWSLKGNMTFHTFSYSESFQVYQKQDFADEFFKNEAVRNVLLPGVSVSSVEVKQVPCSILSMNFFDRLEDPSNGISCGGGRLMRCLDQQVDEFLVSDELRRMMVDKESEKYDLFSESERSEFIFRLLLHLCIGGEWCQYEDYIEPYLTTTKKIYKDLIRVVKDPSTKNLTIMSVVLQVVVRGADGQPCLPTEPENIQNFVYLVVDTVSRQVTALSHQYGKKFYC